MNPAEVATVAITAALTVSNAAALIMWRRTVAERDTALDVVDTIHYRTERDLLTLSHELDATEAERDAAIARAALAETRAGIAHAAWGRAVDKLLQPAPLSFSMPAEDRASFEAMKRGLTAHPYLQAVEHG